MPKEQTTQLQQAAESFYLDCEIRHLTPVTLIWYRKYVGALVTYPLNNSGGILCAKPPLVKDRTHRHGVSSMIGCSYD